IRPRSSPRQQPALAPATRTPAGAPLSRSLRRPTTSRLLLLSSRHKARGRAHATGHSAFVEGVCEAIGWRMINHISQMPGNQSEVLPDISSRGELTATYREYLSPRAI